MRLSEMEKDPEPVAEISRRLATIKNMPYHYQEYLALGEDICATFSFQGYYTIKYGSWPKDLDEDSFKGTRDKLKRDEHEG